MIVVVRTGTYSSFSRSSAALAKSLFRSSSPFFKFYQDDKMPTFVSLLKVPVI